MVELSTLHSQGRVRCELIADEVEAVADANAELEAELRAVYEPLCALALAQRVPVRCEYDDANSSVWVVVPRNSPVSHAHLCV